MSDASSLFPADFLSLMRQSLPDEASFAQFLVFSQQPLRLQSAREYPEDQRGRLSESAPGYGWQLAPVPWCEEGFWISREDESLPLGSVAGHLSGLFCIQEASSMLPVIALFDAQPEVPDSHHPAAGQSALLAPGRKLAQPDASQTFELTTAEAVWKGDTTEDGREGATLSNEERLTVGERSVPSGAYLRHSVKVVALSGTEIS